MLADRIVDRIDAGDCWIWTGRLGRGGYAEVWWLGRTRVAHRVIYEVLVRGLDRSEKLDHLCRVRACVNPDHLDVVSNKTNILRGFGAAAMAARRSTCKQGHPLTPTPDGRRRVCRECGRRWCRQYKATHQTSLASSGLRLSKESNGEH